ncbi:MAG: amidohydrolase family protein [Chloroflexota bacterium]
MTGLIDWHSHHSSPEFAERCVAVGLGPPGIDPEDSGDFVARRSALDACGIDVQLISQTARGGTDSLSSADEMALIRTSNDAIADRIATDPGRFIGSVAVSFRDVPGSIAEIDRLHLRGFRAVLMYPQAGGIFLADRPESRSLFARIAELGLPIFMHGGGTRGAGPDMSHLEDEGAGVAASVYADAAVTECVVRLIAAGTFDRHPGLKIVIRSAGGGLPLLLKKMSWRHKGDGTSRKYSEIFLEHFLIDCASVNARTLHFFIDTLGERNVVFGSDYCGGLGPLSRALPVVNDQSDPDRMRTILNNNSRELLNI